MPDTPRLPRHLRTLGTLWGRLDGWFDRTIVPALPQMTDCIEREQGPRFSELANRETDFLQDWIVRLTAWFNGPLDAALNDPGISDKEMRRVASRLRIFACEVLDRREGLRVLANDPAMRAAAPYLDAAYVSLLRQLRAFIAQVVAVLKPSALHHRDGERCGDTLDLSFGFSPNLDPEMARYRSWMAQVQTRWEAESSAAQAAAASPTAKRCEQIAMAVAIVASIAFFGAVAKWGLASILVMLALLALVWIIRNPMAFVLGILMFAGCSSS